MKSYVYEIGDFVEAYSETNSRGIAKYVITGKYITKHKGVFYDLMDLDREQGNDYKSISLKQKGLLCYRKLINSFGGVREKSEK